MQLTNLERDTILAALRVYQSFVLHDYQEALTDFDPNLAEIATNGGEHEPLTRDEVGKLCEKLNFLESEYKPTLLISVSGGLVDGVTSDCPEFFDGVHIQLADYDVSDDEDEVSVEDDNGRARVADLRVVHSDMGLPISTNEEDHG